MDWFHAFKTNENQALKDIYRLYRKECILHARRKYKVSEEDAVDIFQQSILVLYDNTVSGKLTELSGGVKPYLLGIVRIKSLEYMRTHSKTVYPDDFTAHLATLPDEPLEEENAMIEVVKTLLSQLGASCRHLLQMYYYKDLNLQQIVAETDYTSIDSVKTQKYKCMKRLQTMISEHMKTKGGVL